MSDAPDEHDAAAENGGGIFAKTDMDRRERIVEIISAILLALATLGSAWSAYQATRWSGVQATSFSEASASRAESTRASTAAGQLITIDVTLFANWAAARATDNDALAEFWEERFRTEFKPAFRAWLASEPLTNPDATGTPFEQEQYEVAQIDEAEELQQAADQRAADARAANQRGDNYILTTVLFASVLFFAGMSTKFTSNRLRLGALGLGGLLILTGVLVLALQPVSIGL